MEPKARPTINRRARAPALPKQELASAIASSGIDYLAGAYAALFGGGAPPVIQRPADLIYAFAEALDFASPDRFGQWFHGLPALSQRLLYHTAFTDFAPVSRLEHEVSLLLPESAGGDRNRRRLNPAAGIDFLALSCYYGCQVVSIPEYLRTVVSFYLVPPPLSSLSACLMDETPAPDTVWNRSGPAPECFHRLCNALAAKKEARNQETFLRLGLKKQDRVSLHTASLMASFNREDAPDSVDLAARFILGMYNYRIPKAVTGHEELKRLVGDFFSEKSRHASVWPSDRRFLEYSLCMGYLGKIPYLSGYQLMPSSRGVFHRIIRYMAENAGWYDAEKLLEHITVTGADFSFCDPSFERGFQVKGETIEADGVSYASEPAGVFRPDGIMRRHLIFRPLFKAYCYLFAALGALEIVQKPPALFRVHRGKQLPLSPFEGLSGVRVTEFGKWCLGMLPAPPRAVKDYQVFADSELPIVAVEGDAPECRIYLDTVGIRLGEDRWRISAGSFIAGCTGKGEIRERIQRFKTLIDPNPAIHWRELFTKVLDRAGLFKFPHSDMLLYDVPSDTALVEELMEDRELRGLIRRVENGMIAIAAKDQSRFFALLSEHGVSRF